MDTPPAAPLTPEQRAARAVRVVLGRLARERDLLLLDPIAIEAVAVDVSREVHRSALGRDEGPGPNSASG